MLGSVDSRKHMEHGLMIPELFDVGLRIKYKENLHYRLLSLNIKFLILSKDAYK